MSRNQGNQRRWCLCIVVALAVLWVGCGGESGSRLAADDAGGAGGAGDASGFEGPSGSGGAAGSSAVADGDGLQNNPLDQLFADPGRLSGDFLPGAAPENAVAYAGLANQCYASSNACGASGCEVFATCCVDTDACCKPVDDPALPEILDFTGCVGVGVETCAAGDANTFGPREPEITDRGLIPNGDATSEGGATIGGPTDLATQRVRVDVQFTLPVGCGASCLESAGVAFTATTPGTFVDAEVGLLLSGSRHEVNLMVGGAVTNTFDAGSNQTRWTLIVSPEGVVRVQRDDVLQATRGFDPTELRQAQLVVFGRNLGSQQNSAAIASLETQTSFCDIPKSWDLREPVTVFTGGNELASDRFGRGPSIASDGTEVRVAYAIEGEVFWGRQGQSPEEVELIDVGAALTPTQSHEALGIGDPELVWDGAAWHVFYTARAQNETMSIGHAVAGPADLVFVADSNATLSPSGDVVSLEAPTVLYRDGLWVLIARATLSSGATELQAYYTSALGGGWARVTNGGLEALTRIDSPTDEITEPSLIVHNSAYQLYYARRDGTRWSVMMLASDELLLWRLIGETLAEGTGSFETLGARSPDALSKNDRIDLIYEGQNGVAFQMGLASRVAPSDTAPDIF